MFYLMKDGRLQENPILNRVQVADILNFEDRTGEAAEIGIFEGEYSEAFLDQWKGQRLIGVDPFFNFTWEEYRDGCNRSNMEATMNKCLKRLARFEDRFQLLRLKSTEAAAQFPNETFDYVYLDANHSYDSTRADILAWWPKLRIGGLLGGHDMYTRDDPAQLCEVPKAVNQFVNENRLQLRTTPDTSWWVRKELPGRTIFKRV